MGDNQSYLRWQKIRITQLGYTNNLIIALAIGLLAFIVSYIQTEGLELSYLQKYFFWSGTGLSISSIGLGIYVVVNRLEDFRLTAQIARNREKNKRDTIDSDRIKTAKLGKRTKITFILQIATFLIAFLLLLIMIILEFNEAGKFN